jgi:hypothetical protein
VPIGYTKTSPSEETNLLRRNSYTWAGFGLLVAGVIIFCASFFIFHISWISALGICMLVLSLILLALRKAIPNISPEVCVLLLETGITNMATLIEELGIKSKAIYLPSSLSNKYPHAFIPLHSNGSTPRITRALPQRLIVRYGGNPEDVGLLFSTIGSAATDMLEITPGATSHELETALTSLFSGRLGIADGTRVNTRNKHIEIEINNPRLETDADLSHQCLGGPLAAIVASVAAESWDKPMQITREEQRKGKYYVELEVLG